MTSRFRSWTVSGALGGFCALAAFGCEPQSVPASDDASGGAEAGGQPSGDTGGASGGSQSAGGASPAGGTSSGGDVSSDGGGSGDGGDSPGGQPGSGLCYDEDCPGICSGDCETGFTCDPTPVPCTLAFANFCGCDGVTFTLPSGCAQRAYAHAGACAADDETFDCNPEHILCLPLVAPEPCPEGHVYSVENDCYGDCVPTERCR